MCTENVRTLPLRVGGTKVGSYVAVGLYDKLETLCLHALLYIHAHICATEIAAEAGGHLDLLSTYNGGGSADVTFVPTV